MPSRNKDENNPFPSDFPKPQEYKYSSVFVNNPYTVRGETGWDRARNAYQNAIKFNYPPNEKNFFNDFSNWYRRTAQPNGASRVYTPAPTQNYYLGSNGMVLPLTDEAAEAMAAGNAPTAKDLLVGYGDPNDNNRVDEVPNILTPDGQIVSVDPDQARAKFSEAVQKAYDELVKDKGLPQGYAQEAAYRQQAEQMAMQDMSIYTGANSDNYPKSVAGPTAVPEYRAGQFFATFDAADPRPLTFDEAERLNYLRNSGDRDAAAIEAALFDPKIPNTEKVQILEAVGVQMAEDNTVRPSLSEGLYWSWNPLEMAGQGLLKGMEALAIAYDDYIIPSFTWTTSAMPGGPRTASWEEAQDIAPGQMLATALGPRWSALANGPTTWAGSFVGANIEAAIGTTQNLDELLSGTYDAIVNDEASWKDLGDDIYDTPTREEVFEDDYFGSQISGGLGFSANVIWDPLWLAGPIGKGVRVSHRLGMGAGMIKSADEANMFASHANSAAAVARPYDIAKQALLAAERSGDKAAIGAARVAHDEALAAKNLAFRERDMNTVGKFMNWVMTPKKDGTRRAAEDILNHDVVAQMRVGPAAARAMSMAGSYEELAYILRATVNRDEMALEGLARLENAMPIRARREALAPMLREAQLQSQIDQVVAAPDKYAQISFKLDDEIEAAIENLNRLEIDQARPLDPGTVLADEMVGSDAVRLTDRIRGALTDIDVLRSRRVKLAEEGQSEATIADLDRQIGLAEDAIADVFFGQGYGPFTRLAHPEEYRVAERRLHEAINRKNAFENGVIGRSSGPKDAERHTADLERLIREDEMLRFTLEAEGSALGIRGTNFGIGRMQGAAKYREGVRQRRAERRTHQKATHRGAALRPKAFGRGGWIRESYGRGADRVTVWKWGEGLREVGMDLATRPLTYAMMESPAGLFKVVQGAYNENMREASAVVDNLKMYGDQKVWATAEKGGEAVLTGAQRKAQILERLQKNLMDPTMDPVLVLEKFEKDIMFDMFRYYQPKGANIGTWYEDLRHMVRYLNGEREGLVDTFKARGYWVDESDKAHLSPFLESQLAQGMPLFDFRRMERLVRDYGNNKRFRRASGKQEQWNAAADRAQMQADRGADRLVRSEGIFADITGEIDEMGGIAEVRKLAGEGNKEAKTLLDRQKAAKVGLDNSSKNKARVDADLKKAMANASKAGDKEINRSAGVYESGIQWYDQFQTLWRAGVLLRLGYPTRNAIDGVIRRIAFEASLTPVIEDAVRGAKNLASNTKRGAIRDDTPFFSRAFDRRKNRKEAKARRTFEETGRLTKPVRQFAKREQERIKIYRDSVINRHSNLGRIIEELRADSLDHLDQAAVGAFDDAMLDLLAHQRALAADIDRLDNQLMTLANGSEVDLITAYRQSLDRPRRIGDEFVFGVDGATYYGMMADPRYGRIMAENVSARETQQASLGLSLDIARSVMRAAQIKSGSVVRPGEVNYYTALAYVANKHVANSLVGGLWLRALNGQIDVADAARIIMSREGERARGVGANLPKHKAGLDDDAVKGTAEAKRRAWEADQERLRQIEVEEYDSNRALATRPSMRSAERKQYDAAIRKDLDALAAEKADILARSTEVTKEGADAATYWMQINSLDNIIDVEEVVREAWAQFDRLFPNPEVRQLLTRGPISPEQMKKLLPPDEFNLAAVHGDEIQLMAGSNKPLGMLQRLNPFIEKSFTLAGTFTEDTLVRVPFASRRYQEMIKIGSDLLVDRFPDGAVPAWAVESMLKQARNAAIADTKRYLYTIDRRTNFGRVAERIIPFVSAWQNSVVAFSRMAKMNPEMLPVFEQAYLVPDRMGLTDSDGNVRIPIPAALVGKTVWTPGLGEVPITGTVGDEWVYDHKNLYVAPAQIDPLITFRAGPVIQMSVSNIMQMGLIGPVVPEPIVKVAEAMGGDRNTAQKIWEAAAVATFGVNEETGEPIPPSTAPLSMDKSLPPWGQKLFQLVGTAFGNNPESNTIYASHYTRTAREEILKYMRGERDEMPEAEEIRNLTNGAYFARTLNNMVGLTGGPLGLVTTPGIDSDIYSAAATYRLISDAVGYENASSVFTDLFGDEAMLLMNFSSTDSKGGMPLGTNAMSVAERYKPLIETIAPRIPEDTLGILAFMLDDGSYSNEDYSPSVRAAQLSREIPGTRTTWRELLGPDQQGVRAAVNTGWMMYSQLMTAVYADMRAQGLNSLEASAAAPLKKIKTDFIESMRTDPLYAPWHAEYERGGNERTGNAIDFIRMVRNDQGFMTEGPGADPENMWQTALLWYDQRQWYRENYLQVKGNEAATRALREDWESESNAIAETNPRFNEFWVRYLDEDDLTTD